MVKEQEWLELLFFGAMLMMGAWACREVTCKFLNSSHRTFICRHHRPDPDDREETFILPEKKWMAEGSTYWIASAPGACASETGYQQAGRRCNKITMIAGCSIIPRRVNKYQVINDVTITWMHSNHMTFRGRGGGGGGGWERQV